MFKSGLSQPFRLASNGNTTQVMACTPAPTTPFSEYAPSHLIAVACGNGAAVYGYQGESQGHSPDTGNGRGSNQMPAPQLTHLLRATPSANLVVCSGVLFRDGHVGRRHNGGMQVNDANSIDKSGVNEVLLAVTTVAVDDGPQADSDRTRVGVTLFHIKVDPLSEVHGGQISYVAHHAARIDISPSEGDTIRGPREDGTRMCFHPDPTINILVVAPRVPGAKCTAMVWSSIGETVTTKFGPENYQNLTNSNASTLDSITTAMTFSPCGSYFLTADSSCRIIVWHVEYGAEALDRKPIDEALNVDSFLPPQRPTFRLLHSLAPHSQSSGPAQTLVWSQVQAHGSCDGFVDVIIAGHGTSGALSVWTCEAGRTPSGPSQSLDSVMHGQLTEYAGSFHKKGTMRNSRNSRRNTVTMEGRKKTSFTQDKTKRKTSARDIDDYHGGRSLMLIIPPMCCRGSNATEPLHMFATCTSAIGGTGLKLWPLLRPTVSRAKSPYHKKLENTMASVDQGKPNRFIMTPSLEMKKTKKHAQLPLKISVKIPSAASNTYDTPLQDENRINGRPAGCSQIVLAKKSGDAVGVRANTSEIATSLAPTVTPTMDRSLSLKRRQKYFHSFKTPAPFGTSTPTRRLASNEEELKAMTVTQYRFSRNFSPKQSMTKRLNNLAPPPYPLPTLKEVLEFNGSISFTDDDSQLKGSRAKAISVMNVSPEICKNTKINSDFCSSLGLNFLGLIVLTEQGICTLGIRGSISSEDEYVDSGKQEAVISKSPATVERASHRSYTAKSNFDESRDCAWSPSSHFSSPQNMLGKVRLPPTAKLTLEPSKECIDSGDHVLMKDRESLRLSSSLKPESGSLSQRYAQSLSKQLAALDTSFICEMRDSAAFEEITSALQRDMTRFVLALGAERHSRQTAINIAEKEKLKQSKMEAADKIGAAGRIPVSRVKSDKPPFLTGPYATKKQRKPIFHFF